MPEIVVAAAVTDPLPVMAHVANPGTLPAGTVNERKELRPLNVPDNVPGNSGISFGFDTVTGPETARPFCVAVHTNLSEVPDIGGPSVPDQVPVKFRVDDGDEGEQPPDKLIATINPSAEA